MPKRVPSNLLNQSSENFQSKTNARHKYETRKSTKVLDRSNGTRKSRLEQVRGHIKQKPFPCKICGKSYISYNNRKLHIATIHSESRPYQCNYCNKTCKRKNDLKIHMRIHTDERPYTCNVCDKSFRQRSHLTTHALAHFKETPSTCDICGMTFRHPRYIESHMKGVHFNIRPHKCEICDRAFKIKYSLTLHMRTHDEERKTFTCKICNKAFVDKQYFMKHDSLMHPGQNPFPNVISGETFASTRDIQDSKVVPQRLQQLHKCEVCDKNFFGRSQLISHIRTHTREKPFTCEICNKSYRANYYLTRHIRTHDKKAQARVKSRSLKTG